MNSIFLPDFAKFPSINVWKSYVITSPSNWKKMYQRIYFWIVFICNCNPLQCLEFQILSMFGGLQKSRDKLHLNHFSNLLFPLRANWSLESQSAEKSQKIKGQPKISSLGFWRIHTTQSYFRKAKSFKNAIFRN